MDRVFKVKTSAVHEQFGEESVIVNLDSGSYYSVQGTGDTIWKAMAEGKPQSAIIALLKAAYPNQANVSEDVITFLDEVIQENLVDVEHTSQQHTETDTKDLQPPARQFEPPFLQKYTDMEELLLLDPIHEVDEAGWPIRREAE